MFAAINQYEAERKKVGCHLLFNAFWMVPNFCVNLMYMRDTMHQIDLGVIISFFKAILRKYLECIEIPLNLLGKAAKKLTARLHEMLKKYDSSTGHKMSGKHACLLPLTYAHSTVFSQLASKKKASRHFRASDFRHLLLVLPFILDNLFRNEVDAFNRNNPCHPKLIDPSAELIAVANTLLSWYQLFRRITPPKTDDDISTLRNLSNR